jgi:hypothetical protein
LIWKAHAQEVTGSWGTQIEQEKVWAGEIPALRSLRQEECEFKASLAT